MSDERINILLIEDDKDDYLLLKTYVSKITLPIHLEWVSSYEEGIKQLKTKSNYDLCFVDYRLGEKNGIDFIKESKKLNIPQGIIMLTGQGDDELGIKAMRVGADDYYNKNGLNAETVSRAIRFTLERKKAREQEKELLLAQAEKRLVQQQKAYLNTLLEATTEGIFGMDENAKCTFINSGALKFLGYTEKDCIGKDMHQLTHYKHADGSTYPKEECPIYQAFTTGTPVRLIEETLWHKNGTALTALYSCAPIIENGKVTGGVVTIVDISERKKMEDALRDSQERLKIAQTAGNIGSFEWDIKAKKFIWTPELLSLYGLQPHDLEKSNFGWYELIHPKDVHIVKEAVEKSLKEHVDFIAEFRVIWPNKSIHWIATRAQLFVDEKGKPSKMVGVNIDITKRKELERQKDDFLGIASHELKTPVTSIKAFTQVLANRFAKQGDKNATSLLQKMDGQINKLTVLINDLLDVTKIEGGKLQFNQDHFDFDDLVSEIVEEVQRTTDRHIIEKEGKTQETIYGDRDRIGQVITNFLTNAIKYSPTSDKIVVTSKANKTQVTLSVQDFGVGIPEEEQNHVFERFYRVNSKAHETVPGIGLGLYISAEIIKRQRGEIWVESERGKGSTFGFRLPIQKQKSS